MKPYLAQLQTISEKKLGITDFARSAELDCEFAKVQIEKDKVAVKYGALIDRSPACYVAPGDSFARKAAQTLRDSQAAMKRTCQYASEQTRAARTADCVSPRTKQDSDGLQCVVISNGCSVPVDAYTVAQHKGKSVYRAYTIAPGKKQEACQVTLKGSVQSYVGYCDSGDRQCIRDARRKRK